MILLNKASVKTHLATKFPSRKDGVPILAIGLAWLRIQLVVTTQLLNG
jgi:hypothetical protein